MTERRKRAPAYRQTMHIGLYDPDLENLDRVIAIMKCDPVIGRLHDNIGREKATRYAIAEFLRLHGEAAASKRRGAVTSRAHE